NRYSIGRSRGAPGRSASRCAGSVSNESIPPPGWNAAPAPVYSRAGRSERRMNLFQRHGVRDYTAAEAQIPVIDFGPVFAGEAGALGSVAARVRDACEHVGF